MGVVSYIKRRATPTNIYEQYYVDPSTKEFSVKKNVKNLIFIYLESMESTYASKELGGNQEVNLIPNLTKLADDNISFNHSSTHLGGFTTVNGTGWTTGAIFSTTTGLPLSIPIEGNSMDEHVAFAPNVTALGDILHQLGYRQVFICGSDAHFGGKTKYLKWHGNYDIRDYIDSKEKGYIPEGHFVWWGCEDKYVYKIAKKELKDLAANDEPFNLTLLTVDTHHVGGYVCELCGNEYDEPLANVIKCADNQVYDFVKWVSEQPYYEDTVIVIIGDHPRMDSILVDGVDFIDRKIFNCFINTDYNKEQLNLSDRSLTAMDIFPTTLSALNIFFEGNRLGLGTNMFSDQKTLAEEIGIDTLSIEFSKYSSMYQGFFDYR